MKWMFPILGFTLMAVAIFSLTEARQANVHIRTVAFDNIYGNVTELRIYIKVDDAAEQPATARCDKTTCTFSLPLTDARHVVELSVEQDGKRSAPTRVTLDTTPAK